MDKSEVYRQFAAQCLDMARSMDSQYDRTVLVEMALLWSRLAEHAMQSAACKEDADPASGRGGRDSFISGKALPHKVEWSVSILQTAPSEGPHLKTFGGTCPRAAVF